MIVDDYAAIARRLKQLHTPDFNLPNGMMIVTPRSSSNHHRFARWVFLLEDAGLRMLKSRDDSNALDFVENFRRFLPSARAITYSFIHLSPEDHDRLSDWLNQSCCA